MNFYCRMEAAGSLQECLSQCAECRPAFQREGFHDPLYCPRGRTDCKALAQIIGEAHRSFACCGENDGSGVSVATDHYRMCHKTEDGVDVMMNHDQRDLAHMAAVYSWGLAAAIAVDAGHDKPRTLHATTECAPPSTTTSSKGKE